MNQSAYENLKRELTNDLALAVKYRLPGEIRVCNNTLKTLEDIWKAQNKEEDNNK